MAAHHRADADGEGRPGRHQAEEVSSGLVLNGTNWDTLAAAYGEDSDSSIVFYAAETTMKGKPTLGTRIKIPEAAAKPKLVAAAGAKTKRSLSW